MEALTGRRAMVCRFQALPAGKLKFEYTEIARATEPGIIGHHGVAAHSASIDGIEIVEFNFLSETA